MELVHVNEAGFRSKWSDETLYGVVRHTLSWEDHDMWKVSDNQDCKRLAIYTPLHSREGFQFHLYSRYIESADPR